MGAVVFESMYGENIHLEISYNILFVTLLMVLQPTSALIDCRTACRKCHDNSEAKEILEVYCAMCEECKQRRREKLDAMTATTEAIVPPAMIRNYPPMRMMSEEQRSTFSINVPWTKRTMPTMNPNYSYLHNSNTQEPLRTNIVYPPGCPTPPPCPESEEITASLNLILTTPSTTSTTQCPPIISCRKKKKIDHQSCFPCYPMCPCPMQTQATVTEKQFYNVYIGVPKNLLRKG